MVQVIVTSKDELSHIVIQAVKAALERAAERENNNQMPEDKIYGIKEAAQFLGIAIPTIYAKTSKGNIPHFKRGKRLYFRESELVVWIEEGRQKTVKEEAEAIEDYLNKKKGGAIC